MRLHLSALACDWGFPSRVVQTAPLATRAGAVLGLPTTIHRWSHSKQSRRTASASTVNANKIVNYKRVMQLTSYTTQHKLRTMNCYPRFGIFPHIKSGRLFHKQVTNSFVVDFKIRNQHFVAPTMRCEKAIGKKDNPQPIPRFFLVLNLLVERAETLYHHTWSRLAVSNHCMRLTSACAHIVVVPRKKERRYGYIDR